MNKPEKHEIGFLIELAITGQADRQQFEEVMNRVETEPETAELYRQALAEHQLLEDRIPAAARALEEEQSRNAVQLHARQLEEERLRIEQENDMNLGM